MAEKIRDYIVPLGVLKKHPETKRANRSIKVIHKFMFKHLRKKPSQVFIEPEVNIALWSRGKYALPKKIEVSVLDQEDNVRVFLKDSKALKQRLEENQEEQKEKKKPVEKKEDKAEEKTEEKSAEELEKEAEQQKAEQKIKKRAQHAEIKGKGK